MYYIYIYIYICIIYVYIYIYIYKKILRWINRTTMNLKLKVSYIYIYIYIYNIYIIYGVLLHFNILIDFLFQKHLILQMLKLKEQHFIRLVLCYDCLILPFCVETCSHWIPQTSIVLLLDTPSVSGIFRRRFEVMYLIKHHLPLRKNCSYSELFCYVFPRMRTEYGCCFSR